MNQEARNKIIEAAQKIQKVLDETGTHIRLGRDYEGKRRLCVADNATKIEIGYQEAQLLQSTRKGDNNV